MSDEERGASGLEGLSQWALSPSGQRSDDSTTPPVVKAPDPDAAVSLPEELAGLPFFQQSSLVGERIESWEIEALLGQGGMAAVYRARHVWLKQQAALKVLLPLFAKEPHVLQRFQREAIAISRLSHPNIIEVKDFGFDPGHGLFMVMEYLEGQDLEAVMDQAPFTRAWVMSLFEQVCAGLQVIHDAGVLHRDLKPSNLFLLPGEPFPQVKILDFGVAKVQFQGEGDDKLTRTGVIVGTPRYLSPEQIHHLLELSPASDLYALGVILFECLTGEFPMASDSMSNYLARIVKEPPALLSAHRPELAGTPIEAFVTKALAKHPEERPASALAFWEEFAAAMESYVEPDTRAKSPTISYAAVGREEIKQTPRQLVAYETNGAEVRASSHEGVPSTAGADASERGSSPREGLPSGESTPPGRPMWVVGLIALLVCLLGGVAWYALQLQREITTRGATTRSRVVPRRDAGAGLLDGLVIQGRKALQQQQYTKAEAFWKRAIQQPGWRKSQYYPKLYRAIGIALSKQHKLHSAMVYYQKYKRGVQRERARIAALRQRVDAARSVDLAQHKALAARLASLLKRVPDASEVKRELATMMELEDELKKRAHKTALLLAAFKARWSEKKWPESLKLYQQIQKRAPSIPSVHVKLAASLAQHLVSMGRQRLLLVQREMEPGPSQRRQIRATLQTYERQLKQLRQGWQRSLQTAGRWLARRNKARASQELRRLLRGTKLMDGAFHQRWRRWLQDQSRQMPGRSRSLWRLYAVGLQRLQRQGAWSWLKLQEPDALNARQARQMDRVLRGILQAQKLRGRASQALAQGSLPGAVKAAKRFLQIVAAIKPLDPWRLGSSLTPHIPVMKAMTSQFASISTRLMDATKAFQVARFDKARQLHKAILASLKPGSARDKLSGLFQRRERTMQQGQTQLRLGHRAFARFQWAEARRHYKAYQTRFPLHHQRAMLKKRLKVCRCLLKIFPWEVCSGIKLPRGYQTPGAR